MTAVAATLFVVAFAAAFYVQLTEHNFFAYAPFRKITKNLPETEVVRLLGPPEKTQPLSDPFDYSYKVIGYTFRPFKTTGTLSIYQRKNEVCYILFKDGQVSDFFIGYEE